jgi:hypothetical protein
MERCARWETCSFFMDYFRGKDRRWESLVEAYCFGKMNSLCERLAYFDKGLMPPDNLLPMGIFPEEDMA